MDESVASSPPSLVARSGRTCDETSTRRCGRGLSRGRGPDGVGRGARRPGPWGKDSPRAWTVAGSSCGPRGSRLGAKIELSVSAFPDRRRPRGSVVRGSAARRRGPPSDPAGSTGLALRDEPSTRGVSGPGDPDALLSLPAPSPIFCFWPDLCFFAPQAKNRNQAPRKDDLHCRSQHCARTRRPWRVHGPRRDLGPVRDAERPRIVPPGRRSSDARQVRCGLRPGGRPGRARPLPAQGCRRRGRGRRVARAERSEDPRAFYFVSSPRPQATGTTTWSRCRAWSCRPRLSLPAARNASRCSSTTATGPTPSSTA